MNQFLYFPAAFRVGVVDTLARRLAAVPQVGRRALLSAMSIGVLSMLLNLAGCEECPASEFLSAECGVRSGIHAQLAALSQIESGDNDNAIGRSGEVTRYQIMPALWFSGIGKNRNAITGRFISPTNKQMADIAAVALMMDRENRFWNINHRVPTDFEWYLLWHRPAIYLSKNRPARSREIDRAQRFANLCQQLSREVHP